MRLLVLLLFIFSTSQLGHAQYGMSAKFYSAKLRSIEKDDFSSREILSTASGYQLGLNYWLRLKNIRLEFFPEIAFAHLDAKPKEIADYSLRQWSLSIPASLYLLDLKGDCHCPTFSKQNDLVKKGLFIQLITSLEHEKAIFDNPTDTKWHQNIGAGLGCGLDFGISDFLTVTPLVQYLSTLYTTKEDLRPGTNHGWRAGVRVLFRPDYR